jgi:hypothetical protein
MTEPAPAGRERIAAERARLREERENRHYFRVGLAAIAIAAAAVVVAGLLITGVI